MGGRGDQQEILEVRGKILEPQDRVMGRLVHDEGLDWVGELLEGKSWAPTRGLLASD